MTRIFISYRRQENERDAEIIRDELAKTYGKRNVFLDKSDVPPGAPFPNYLNQKVKNSDIMLAIIGSRWEDYFEIRQRDAQRDFVRLELEKALKLDKVIIPILINRGNPPVSSKLPPSIRDIADYNVFWMNVEPWEYPQLVSQLTELIDRHYKSNRQYLSTFINIALVTVLVLTILVLLSRNYIIENFFSDDPNATSPPVAVIPTPQAQPDDDPVAPPQDDPTEQSQLVYVREDDGNPDIILSQMDGSQQSNLTSTSALDYDPAWSPNHELIAFASNVDSNLFNIYLMDLDGNLKENLTNRRGNSRHPSWSPNGNELVFYSDRDGTVSLYVVAASGGNANPITPDDTIDTHPEWSPVSNEIAFISTVFDNVSGNFTDIFIVDKDTGAIQQLTNTRSKTELMLDWSPDGSEIIYSAQPADGSSASIYVWDMANGTFDTLIDDGYYNNDPRFLDDGQRFIFSSNRDGTENLYIYDRQTQSITQAIVDPSYSITQPAVPR